MQRGTASCVIALCAAVAAGPAKAHVVFAPGSPVEAVLHHPAFEPVHALVLLAAGLWAGQTGGRAGFAALAGLFAGVVAGIALVALDAAPPWRPLVLFATMIGFGALTAAARALPWWLVGGLAAIAGLYQGAVGSLPPFRGGTGDWSADQVIVAAILLPLIGHQIAARARAGWTRIVVRVAASWIAGAGILMFAFTFRL